MARSKGRRQRGKGSDPVEPGGAGERGKPLPSEVLSLDRRSMERVMADMHALFASQEFETLEEADEFAQKALSEGGPPRATPQTELARAQDLMYDAFDAKGKARARLAREALEISPDCADAYVLLAEEEAGTHEEAVALYQQGVEAGERALGPKAFEELRGHFWAALETRPYMRARHGLAMCQWELGRREEAVTHLQAMLELNPNDNQGSRMVLCFWLLKLRRDRDLRVLLHQFREDGSLQILWARALWTFRTRGAGQLARQRLRDAIDRNPTIVGLLLGVRPFPREPSPYVAMGGEDEAAHMAAAVMPVLNEDEEAAEWLVDELHALLDEFADPE